MLYFLFVLVVVFELEFVGKNIMFMVVLVLLGRGSFCFLNYWLNSFYGILVIMFVLLLELLLVR